MINDTGVNGIILREFIFVYSILPLTIYVVELKGYLVILL